MTVKLIKKQPGSGEAVNPSEHPENRQMLPDARLWIDEFRAQKARDQKALLQWAKRL